MVKGGQSVFKILNIGILRSWTGSRRGLHLLAGVLFAFVLSLAHGAFADSPQLGMSPQPDFKLLQKHYLRLAEINRLPNSQLVNFLAGLGIEVFDGSQGHLKRDLPNDVEELHRRTVAESKSSDFKIMGAYYSALDHKIRRFNGRALIVLPRSWSRWELLHEVFHHLLEQERAHQGTARSTDELIRLVHNPSEQVSANQRQIAREQLLDQTLREEILIERCLTQFFIVLGLGETNLIGPSLRTEIDTGAMTGMTLKALSKTHSYQAWAERELQARLQ